MGRTLYGYCWNRGPRLSEVVDDEANAIRAVVDWYVNKNLDIMKITTNLIGRLKSNRVPATASITFMD